MVQKFFEKAVSAGNCQRGSLDWSQFFSSWQQRQLHVTDY